MSQQLSAAQTKARSLENEIADYEDRRKRMAASLNQGRDARDSSEGRYLVEEKLRDEVKYLKRQRLELESLLLERENAAMVMAFEKETSETEISRYKRRCSELELAFKTLQGLIASGGVAVGGGTSAGASGAATGGNLVGILTREEERLLSMPVNALLSQPPPGSAPSGGIRGNLFSYTISPM
jgi:hypothetical protein